MAATYSSLSHSLWALALSWIVVACSTGYGGKYLLVIVTIKLQINIKTQF